jgi:hypothetical protein
MRPTANDRPSAAELDALEAEINERFPDWIFAGVGSGYGDTYLIAERRFLVNGRTEKQYGRDPEHLLLAIEQREKQFKSMPDMTVAVVDGFENTTSQPSREGERNG